MKRIRGKQSYFISLNRVEWNQLTAGYKRKENKNWGATLNIAKNIVWKLKLSLFILLNQDVMHPALTNSKETKSYVKQKNVKQIKKEISNINDQ